MNASMNDGTLQAQRALAVMESRHFEVDGLQIDQLLAMCERLSQHLRFIDLNNQQEGTWQALFENDDSMVLARIASFDRYAWRQDFLKVSDTQSPQHLAGEVLALAQRMDRWYRHLQHSAQEAAVVVCDAIEQVVQRQLGAQLVQMVGLFDVPPDRSGERSDERSEEQPGGVRNPLRSGYAQLHAQLWPALGAPSGPHALRASRSSLRGLGFTVFQATARIQLLAREHLGASLDGGAHEPGAGLLLAFLRLVGPVQEQVNGFTARHIDFYYRRVLGLQERGAQPDRVHVVCQPDPRSTGAVEIAPGTLFKAGKDDAGRPVQFCAPQGLAVGPARVAALATLQRERDGRIAPEASMDFVTSVKAHWLGLPAFQDEAQADAVPLLGGGPGSVEADLGLAVASPLLLLKEGERSIELDLALSWPDPLAQLVQRAVQAPHAAAFRRALGEVFACWLLGDGSELNADQRAALTARAAKLHVSLGHVRENDTRRGDPPPLLRMCSDEPDARRRVFHKVINDLFDVSLSTAAGWLVVDRIQFSLPQTHNGNGKVAGRDGDGDGNSSSDSSNDSSGGGLNLRIVLRTEDPAVVGCDPKVHRTARGGEAGAGPGQAWPTRLPVLRLQVSPRAGIHPCSLFESAHFGGAELRVSVRGARDLLLHNQLGPLDAQKPFAPFGPLPTTTSYLVIGSPEAARKPLDSLRLQLRWGGLPDDPGGWATHYAAYGEDLRKGRFASALHLLDSGQWWACGGRSTQQPLFGRAASEDDALPAEQAFDVDPRAVHEHAGGSSVPLENTFTARDGLLRLQLCQPRGAFGHAAYPELLSQAVRSRSWRRGQALMPRPPYTPELESIRLDYSAHTTLGVRPVAAAGDSAHGLARDSERLLHIHPFGVCELLPDKARRCHTLLPPLDADGSLYIGVQADALQGELTLLFQLRPAAAMAVDDDEAPERLQWAYLAQDRWHTLGEREVRADGTFGMLASGVVSLDLPEGARCARKDNQLFGGPQGGLYWLRLSSPRLADTVSPLLNVYAQALPLQRVLDGGKNSDKAKDAGSETAALQPLPAGRVTAADSKVPGLASVLQVQASVGLRPAEDARQLRTRAGERLRHKNRGSLIWDIERLVLDNFPEVFKVRCFSWTEVRAHHEDPPDGLPHDPASDPPAGTVVVAVVPQVPRNDPACATLAPRLDSLALRRIKLLLAGQVSPWVTLDVRNATFERVQARCSLRLEPTAQAGVVRRRVNTVITHYLSPWFDEGFGPRFDWLLRCEDVETQVRQVPGVAEVAGLSLLHVTHGSEGHGPANYRLGDTAAARQREGGRNSLASRRPWGLALPLGDHLIAFGDDLKGIRPQATGLDQLSIGQTFVVGLSPVQQGPEFA